MSVEAMSWVLKQDMSRSSEKFILVCLANYSDEYGICYPSARTLMRDTGQDRKTVLLNLKRLCESGLLRDTGRRVGGTMSVIVYEIVGMPSNSRVHYVYRVTDLASGEYYIGKRSFNGEPELDTYRGSGRWVLDRQSKGIPLHREVLEVFDTDVEARACEMRWFKHIGADPLCKNEGTPHALSRDKRCAGSSPIFPTSGSSPVFPTPESSPVFPGSSPVIPASSPVIPPKQAQKRDTEPSVEPLETTIEEKTKPAAPAMPPAPPPPVTKAAKSKANPATPVVVLPDWLPESTWNMWVSHRIAVKAPLTQDAAELCIKRLAKLRAEGSDPVAVIEASVMTGKWTGLFAIKSDQPTSQPATGRTPKFDPTAHVNSGAAYVHPSPASASEPYTIDAKFVEYPS